MKLTLGYSTERSSLVKQYTEGRRRGYTQPFGYFGYPNLADHSDSSSKHDAHRESRPCFPEWRSGSTPQVPEPRASYSCKKSNARVFLFVCGCLRHGTLRWAVNCAPLK